MIEKRVFRSLSHRVRAIVHNFYFEGARCGRVQNGSGTVAAKIVTTTMKTTTTKTTPVVTAEVAAITIRQKEQSTKQ